MRKHVSGATKRIVAIVSPKGGSGKTTVSLNLSLSIARQGRSVVLVDSDINGDVLSCVNARSRAKLGTFDVLLDGADFRRALINTILPGFRILPAVGSALPEAPRFGLDYTTQWQALLDALAKEADIVIVDTPAGMFGVTHQVLSASTHALAVHQSEVIAQRSFTRFAEALTAMPEGRRPVVLGVVINMLHMRHSASLTVFQNACTELPSDWLFDTAIPRSPAFLDASEKGVPLRLIDDHAPPAVAWLFDNLAAEVTTRLGLEAAVRRPQQLLAD
jgi:cellulose biosynthesis protein BcsQ